MPLKIVVVSPHRDDAAFSLGLSIGSWIEAEHTVEVVNCFTRSDYAPFAEFEFIHSNDRLPRVTALRLREDQAWAKMYGRGLRLADLNLKDAPLRLRVAADEVLTRAVNAEDKAMAKLPKAVAALRPDAVVVPLAVGAHVDHRTVRSAMVEAGLPEGLPCAFYEDLPDAAWPGMAETIEAVAQELGRGLEPVFVTSKGAVAQAVARKRRLALCYDSQIADAVADEIAEFCVQYGGRERMWADAAWRAAGLMVEEREV
jgi:LmbE family N-acetylglucosaminyl deacetylase